jgi:hypothetical protein
MLAQIERIATQATDRIVTSVAAFLPGLFALFGLLVGAVVVAIVLRTLVFRALSSLDFDRRAPYWGLALLAEWSPTKSASAFVARAVQWIVLLCGLLIALTALDAAIPSQFAMSVFEYVPNMLAAIIILAVGSVLAQFFARAVLIGAVNMQIHSARLLSLGVKWLVLIVAAAMALEQLRIGRQILMLAFGILFGGVVLATALAIGLGAKDVVGRALDRELRRGDSPDRDRLDHV